MGVFWQRMQAAWRLRARQLAGALESLREAPAAEVAAGRPTRPTRWRARRWCCATTCATAASIERAYRRAISTARSEIIIANAYFVPGRTMRKALDPRGTRGVRVQLLLQGR
jgi:cardiolipin synthase